MDKLRGESEIASVPRPQSLQSLSLSPLTSCGRARIVQMNCKASTAVQNGSQGNTATSGTRYGRKYNSCLLCDDKVDATARTCGFQCLSAVSAVPVATAPDSQLHSAYVVASGAFNQFWEVLLTKSPFRGSIHRKFWCYS
jgi:hypothetical protein